MESTIICCDMKSFYASCECVDRGLDPLTTNLVVADKTRTEKTICLAVSPSMKALGIPGRPRLFEVVQKVKEANAARSFRAPGGSFSGSSHQFPELQQNPALSIDYIVAPPRMARYIEVSTQIYSIFLEFVAPEDIIVYSVDEAFLDVTSYLKTYGMSAHDLAMKIIHRVLEKTKITATIGIGTNLYLGKVAMDIMAKHMPADANGVRIAELNEETYRKYLWDHRPLTAFWRVGRGYVKRLQELGLFTMGDIARCSLEYEDLLYRTFGVNAELLIDHAWGWEPCTTKDVKAYKPENNTLGAGQVLGCAYGREKTRVIVREMADQLSLDLVQKRLVTDQLVLDIGFDAESLERGYQGKLHANYYGKTVPEHAHGSIHLDRQTASTRLITEAAVKLFDEIFDDDVRMSRRISITAVHVVPEDMATVKEEFRQLDLFTDFEAEEKRRKEEDLLLEKEKKLQQGILAMKGKYGKNAVMKGMDLLDGATAISRNEQVGGHRAGNIGGLPEEEIDRFSAKKDSSADSMKTSSPSTDINSSAQRSQRIHSALSDLPITHAYDDIIHLPHHRSSVHPPLSMESRAAQFSPFAALTGYEEAVAATAKDAEVKVQNEIELSREDLD